VLGPTVWNSLSNYLRDPDLSIASFGRLLKDTSVSVVLSASSALEALCDNAMLYKLTLTSTFRSSVVHSLLGMFATGFRYVLTSSTLPENTGGLLAKSPAISFALSSLSHSTYAYLQ